MKPHPAQWDPITDNAVRLVELDWRAGVKAGNTLRAATMDFVGVPAGLTFASAAINGHKTQALMSHPGSVNKAAQFLIYAKVTVDETGEVLETQPPIRLEVRQGGVY